jgi:TonB family protein
VKLMWYFVRFTYRALGVSALLSAALFVSAQDHPSSAPPDSLPLKVCSKTNPQPCATAPHPIYTPDPEYSDKARKKKKKGTVILETVVGTDGLTHDIHVLHPIGYGLDEQAIKALGQWKFEPATKDGQPVPVVLQIEMDFRLY